jgi:hypothetical protein
METTMSSDNKEPQCTVVRVNQRVVLELGEEEEDDDDDVDLNFDHAKRSQSGDDTIRKRRRKTSMRISRI